MVIIEMNLSLMNVPLSQIEILLMFVCFFFQVCCVYYESINRNLNKRLVYECRCDERLKAKDEGST